MGNKDGTAYASRAPGFTPPLLLVGSVLISVLVFCVLLFFFCHRPVSCVPNVASVSGLSILDCHFGFLKRLFRIFLLQSNIIANQLI